MSRKLDWKKILDDPEMERKIEEMLNKADKIGYGRFKSPYPY